MLIGPLSPDRYDAAVQLWHDVGPRGDNATALGFYGSIGYTHDDVVVLSRRLG